MLQEYNSRRMIYLAEDDPDDSILFLEALKDLHPEITVKISEDGQQLLDNLRNTEYEKPEIIFLDINMPCKNGFECLKEIRESKSSFSNIKIIMFSTSSSKLHMELSYKLGADFYGVKPRSIQDFRALLRSIMAIDWTTATRQRSDFVLVCQNINTF